MRSFWLLVSLIAGAPMLANAETFDTSFNGTGKVLFRIENTDLRAVAALPMPNGEIVQVMASVSNPVFLVARRYSATGAVVNIVVPTIEWSGIYAAAVDGSGRVVVVGTIDGGARGTDMAVMRLKPDLTIDGTFSGDGLATFDYIGTNDYAKAVAIDQRDNIVIVGSTFQSAADSDFLIVRMRSDGTMDSTFNSGGFRRIPFDLGSPFQDQATAVAIGNDGKIVIGGNALDNNFGRVRVAMARLLPNGAYDTTFCNGGCSTNAGYNTIQNGRTVYYFGLNTDHADERSALVASLSPAPRTPTTARPAAARLRDLRPAGPMTANPCRQVWAAMQCLAVSAAPMQQARACSSLAPADPEKFFSCCRHSPRHLRRWPTTAAATASPTTARSVSAAAPRLVTSARTLRASSTSTAAAGRYFRVAALRTQQTRRGPCSRRALPTPRARSRTGFSAVDSTDHGTHGRLSLRFWQRSSRTFTEAGA